MKILLIASLIFSLVVYLYRIIEWGVVAYKLLRNDKETREQLNKLDKYVSNTAYIVGGIEHFIVFASLLASLIIIW